MADGRRVDPFGVREGASLMSAYRYWQGPGGERVCISTHPTFVCPHGSFERERDEEGKVIRRIPTPAAEAAARALGADVDLVVRMLDRQHGQVSAGRRRVDGKLTDDCAVCGARMERKGFRVWIERPVPEEERTEGERASAAINSRLNGGPAVAFRTAKTAWLDTKREARAWCLDELRILRSAAGVS
jgi:hypothetical protein